MQRWQIGQVRVTRVVELETASIGKFVLPDAVPDNVKPIGWLRPHFVDSDGRLVMSIHALVVESQGRRIVVDTCIGNDKPRALPAWNMMQGTFLEDLAAAGHGRESIDTVVCTHLHVDHVGWNTMWVDGAWVPTFPNARYLFARSEWEHWSREDSAFAPNLSDAVRPVIDAGLADLVETDHRITGSVWLDATPGHTPGHVAVRIESQGARAMITGDLTHHPVQWAEVDWKMGADSDSAEAAKTRRRLLAELADGDLLVIGTHYAEPCSGRLVRDGQGGHRFEVSPR